MIVVNNQLQVAKLKMAYILSFFVGIGLSIPIFVTQHVTTEHIVMSVLGILFLFYFLYLVIIKPEYIFMAEVRGKLQVKNYPARPVLREYKAFEINLDTLDHIEIKKSFFGKKIHLTIWVKTQKGIGNYPSLSLSALSSLEQKKVSKFLSQYSKNKEKNIIQL